MVLKDRSTFRGLITEIVTNSHVVLLLPSGESRRFEMSEVRYAGPAANMPQAKPEAAPEDSDEPKKAEKSASNKKKVKLILDANLPDVTFWAQRVDGDRDSDSPSGFAVLCVADCTTRVMPGEYKFRLALGQGKPKMTKGTFQISGTTRVHGDIVSKRGTRAVGWLVLSLASVVSTGLVYAYATSTSDDNSNYLVGAAVLQLLGFGIGLPLGLTRTVSRSMWRTSSRSPPFSRPILPALWRP